MAVKQRKGNWFIYCRLFGKQVGVRVDVPTKAEARQVEAMMVRACKTGDYGILDAVSRATLVRLFENQGWALPKGIQGEENPAEALTLIKAVKLFLTYAPIHQSKTKRRYGWALEHLLVTLGRNKPVRDLWAPDIRLYQQTRLAAGAREQTVNWETSTLSKLFRVLQEMRLVDANPVRLVPQLSRKSGERSAYIAYKDVERIASQCPEWYANMIWVSYYTGARRGELLNLRRGQVNLSRRVITLTPDTKESGWKTIPLRVEAAAIIESCIKVTALGSEHVFLMQDWRGVRPVNEEATKNPWPRALEALEWKKHKPVFHDLRHTWRANARMSGMDPVIAESILGHWHRQKSVNERYGLVDDIELVKAVDAMVFDHGRDTQVLVARAEGADEKCEQNVNKSVKKKKRSGGALT